MARPAALTTFDEAPATITSPGGQTLKLLLRSPSAVAELDRQLNLNESVLRTKLMRPEVH